MAVTIILRKEKFYVSESTTVKEALIQINLLPEAYIIIRNGVLLTENDRLEQGDQVTLIPAISGGV